MTSLLSSDPHCRKRLPAILLMLSGLAFSTMSYTGAGQSGDGERKAGRPDPAPTPFIQREEVRFVTLDLLVDEHAKGGWRRATSLTLEQVHLFVGGNEVVLDLFENWCDASLRPSSRSESSAGAVTGAGPGTLQTPEPAGDKDEGIDRVAETSSPTKYVIYFDVQHLTFGGRASAFDAAAEWTRNAADKEAEAMIVVGGMSLRVVRPMLPIRRHLLEDIEAARKDFSSQDMWAQGEHHRIEEIKDLARSNPQAARSLAQSYAGVDYDVSVRALDNLRDLMSLFGTIQGTKNLLVFSETLRLEPGRQYFPGLTLISVHPQLSDVVRQANEKSVRIYTIQAAGLVLGRTPDNEDSLTMMASETGGVSVSRTNRLAMLFDRAEEDASCFYRIGFRMPVRHSGNSRTILVRVGETGRGYRVRYRRSVADPSREQEETDHLMSAFLAPRSAQGFPTELRVARLFDHPLGSRMRIEAEVPLQGLLTLPASGSPPTGNSAAVLIGGRIVSLLGDAASHAVSLEDSWSAADPMRRSLGFDSRTELHLPATGDRRARSRIVYTGEFDAPPGDYRIVSVAQDALAGSTSARMLDFQVRAASTALGEIGLGIRDPSAIIVTREGSEDRKDAGKQAGRPELSKTPPALPDYLLVAGTSSASSGRPLWLFYSVCGESADVEGDPHGASRASKGTAAVKRFEGWTLRRELACGGEAIHLAPRAVPEDPGAGPCLLIVDSLPASQMEPGACRFDVHLERPGHPSVSRTREFQVSSAGLARGEASGPAGP